MNIRVLPVFLLACALLAAGTAWADESVRVRGGVHADFGRLVFDWQTPVGYRARLAGETLVVTFDRPARFDTASAERHLFRYLDGIAANDAGTEIRFDLKRGYGLKGFTLGPKVVLDLQHGGAGGTVASADAPPPGPAPEPAPQAAPQPAPQSAPEVAAQAPAAPPPEIRVRTGTHEAFERLVFDWPEPVGYSVEQEGESATVVFDRPARLDVAALQASPPTLLRRFEDRRVDGRLRVGLRFVPGASVRAFTDGPRVVVDLMRPDPNAPARAAAQETEPATAGAQSAPASAAAAQAEPPARVETADSQAATPPTPLVPQPETEPQPAAETPPPAEPADEVAQRDETASAAPAPQSPPEPAPSEPASAPDSAPAAQAQSADADPAAARSEGGFLMREAVAEVDGRPQTGQRAPQTPPVLLRFDWQAPVGAVALRRGGDLLLGFDAMPPVDMAAAIAELAPELGRVEAIEVEGGSLLRFAEAPLYAPRLSRSDSGWLVEFRRAGTAPRRTVPAIAEQVDDGTARLRVAVDAPRAQLTLSDPATAGTLILIPLSGPGQGMGEGRDFPGFALLPTAQGLAVLPRLEDLEVALVDDGVLLSGPVAGLTPGAEAAAAQRAPVDAAELPRQLDLEAWRQGPPSVFNERRQALQRAVIDSETADLGVARLDLARFFFAHGLSSEALGVLALIERENPELRDDPQLLLMEAASRLLVGDHARAQTLLGDPALLEEPEADLWRAALAAEAQDWPAAAAQFARTAPLVEDYARPVRVKLHLAAAEAAFESGDPGATAQYLERARPDVVTDIESARYDFLSALLLAADGQTSKADRILERLAVSGLGAPSVRARLERIDRALAAGTLPAGEAIEQLEQLRFAWRGDAFEFALLQRLAELYQQEGRWREALRALRQAATYFPGSPKAEAAADALSALFARVFLGPDKPQVPPLTALSLYEEFRELTPAGARGNLLIEQLADRLVAVDLLDRAAGLLDNQVRFRLQGEDRARVGARLALIRLLDRQPREALEALEASAHEGLPTELARQRRHLQARALSDLGRAAQALALLEGDDSLDALRLRAEILWAERDWAAAAVALEATLPAPDAVLSETQPLDSLVSGQVLNLAVAQTLAGDAEGVSRLRGDWGSAMAEGPHAEAFALLAEDLDPDSVATIAGQLAQVDRVQAFMATYRERLRDAQLSDLN